MSKRATPHQGAILLVLMVAGLLMAIQQTLVVPLLPKFTTILNAPSSDVSWLVTITLLTGCVSVPITSRMADMYGKKLMLMISVGFMVLGSIVAMSAPLLPLLLLGRGLQGMSMAIVPIGIGVLRETVAPHKVATSIAIMSATMGVGGSLALPLSGVLSTAFGWQAVFVVVAVIGALLLILVAALVPESGVRSGGRFDYLGAVLLAISLGAMLVVLSKGSALRWNSPTVLGLIATAVIFAVLWAWTQTRVSNPLVDLGTLRNRPVVLTNAYSLLIGFAMLANMLLVTYQLQMPTSTGYGLGLDVFTATLVMLPGGLVMAALSPLSGALINRLGARFVLALGASITTVGYTSLFFWHNDVLALIIGSSTLAAGTAFAYAAQPTMIMSNVPDDEIAASNGINSLLRSIGGSVASALSAGLLVAFVTTDIAGGVPLPAWTGFGVTYATAIAASIVAVGLAIAIPRSADTIRVRQGVQIT